MRINKKFATLAITLTAFISCSTSEVRNSGKVVENQNNIKEDITINYRRTSPNPALYPKDFKLVGTDYIYDGEEIYVGKRISIDAVITKAYAKNPVIEVDSEDERYAKYSENVDGKIQVEDLENGKRKITFLDQKTVYVSVQIKNGDNIETKEIMLDQPIKVIDKIPSPENNVRYNKLKEGYDNNRVSYDVVTYNGGYESESKSYDTYYEYDKYQDLDDLVGVKKSDVLTKIGNKDKGINQVNVDFGIKIKDFEGKYDTLLADLSKTTLKFSEDGSQINGGFNPDLIEKLKKYEKNRIGTDENLKFVTEILDNDKKRVGRHRVSRKILKDGIVLFEKQEDTFVTFPGTTIAVADSTFYDVTSDFEERMLRSLPKGLDKKEDDGDDEYLDLSRPHGTTVIGAATDEIAMGKSHYIKSVFADDLGAIQTYLILGINRDFKTKESVTQESDIESGLEKAISKYTESGSDLLLNPIFYNKYQKFVEFKDTYENKKEEIEKLSTDEEKNEAYSNFYRSAFNLFEEVIAIPENDLLKGTDLHFRTIALEDGKGLKTDRVAKYLPIILEEDKNIKAVNMSYGAEGSYEEYLAIRDMSEEAKKKATEEYNNNPLFRAIVRAWLHDNDYGSLDRYKEYFPGDLGIPSMIKYFEARDKITKNDYQKLLDLRMLSLAGMLKTAEELVVSNKDVLFVIAQGNSLNNSDQTQINLTDFDEDGNKILLLDGDRKYNNPFTSIPLYLNEKERLRTEKTGDKFKYNYSYRKNMLGVVGLISKEITLGSSDTDDLSDEYGLVTSDVTEYNKLMLYVKELESSYNELMKILDDAEANPKKYPKGYVDKIKEQAENIQNMTLLEKDPNGRDLKMSFTRAGKSKLWVVASEGNYSYAKKLSEKARKYVEEELNVSSPINNDSVGVSPLNTGSSFSAPRVSAIVGEVGNRFPWMSAQQIKQTILTTATDDARIKVKKDGEDEVKTRVGIYGPDENIGWGIANKEAAYNGPARFVKALTHETEDENFVANIPYGIYEFSNDIEGGYDKSLYALTRKAISDEEFVALEAVKEYTKKDVLSSEFDTNENTKSIAELLKELSISKESIYEEIIPKLEKYISGLDFEERELFEDAGLVKKGEGTLVLSGINTYTEPTVIEEGTLIFRGSSKSPFIINKNSKLKLDMKYSEEINKLIDEDYVANIDANVVNEGGLYSYSESDRILKSYVPIKGSKTLIASIGHLYVDNLDLSKTDRFDFDVFRKKGMQLTEDDNSEKEILSVEKIAKKDLYKLNLGNRSLTSNIDLVIETAAIENDSENVSLVAKLVRKNNVNPKASSLLRVKLEKELLNASGKEKEKLADALEELDWMSEAEADSLNGDVLANAQVIAIELQNLKNSLIRNNLEVKGNVDKYSVFVDILTSNKFKFNDADKSITNNGVLLGFNYTKDNAIFGASFNYSHSTLRDYKLTLKDVDYKIPNDASDEEKAKYEEEKAIKTLRGNVYAHNFGVSGFAKYDINDTYISTIANIDYLAKNTQRKIGDRNVVEADSSDFVLGLNLEGGYKFKFNEKYEFIPFIGTNLLGYLKGSFNENTNFGYKSDSEFFFKNNISLGAKTRAYINDKFNIGANISYSKYITDTLLKSNIELADYNFKYNAKGLALQDNVFEYGIDAKYRFKDNLELGFGYQGTTTGYNTLRLAIKAEF